MAGEQKFWRIIHLFIAVAKNNADRAAMFQGMYETFDANQIAD